MPIQSISTAQTKQGVIKSTSAFKKWISQKDPIMQDINLNTIIFNNKLKRARFCKKYLTRKMVDVSPSGYIEKGLQEKVSTALGLIRKIGSIVNPSKDSVYSFKQELKKGLDQFMLPRKERGQFVVKNPKSEEIAIIFPPHVDGGFKMIIQDSQGKPQRWYYILDNMIIKNYNPAKKTPSYQYEFANKKELDQIKEPLGNDLSWVTDTLTKAVNFIKKDILGNNI